MRTSTRSHFQSFRSNFRCPMDRCVFSIRSTSWDKTSLPLKYLAIVKPVSRWTILPGSRKQSTLAIHKQSIDRRRNINRKPTRSTEKSLSGLERLPTSILVRSLVLGRLFTTPFLFEPSFWVLRKIADSRSRMLNVDTNPLLRKLIKPLIYDQFCAGRDESEVAKTRDKIRGIGYSGVILCYGREVVIDASEKFLPIGKSNAKGDVEIAEWRDGNLKTLDMIGAGDWLGIKFTGAGQEVTNALMQHREPCSAFIAAMDDICQKAKQRGCRLWIDAEQQVLQTAIDSWAVDLMRKYNSDGSALVYNTLQAYLKCSRDKLRAQLAIAADEGWIPAIKLVRGAYINNDKRTGIHDTKQDTDDSYNKIVGDILTQSNLGDFKKGFPRTELFIAGHNPTSVARAMDLVATLGKKDRLRTIPAFGQLQGMADEVGCKLLEDCERLRLQQQSGNEAFIVPNAYKCLTWGSLQECMQFLIRRVVENRGGIERMRDGLSAYQAELKRRILRRDMG